MSRGELTAAGLACALACPLFALLVAHAGAAALYLFTRPQGHYHGGSDAR